MNVDHSGEIAVVPGYRRGLHVVSLLTVCALLPLMLVGAGVTSKGAGMAFPDWPTSNSHLLNPPGWLEEEAKFWEHGHRLIGWVVGMLAIVLAVSLWKARGIRRTMGLVVLGAIIVQGVLGGLRVTEVSTSLAVVHGVWAQVCFCLACVVVMLTSESWLTSAGALTARGTMFFRRGCVAASIVVFVQLVSGAVFRHFRWQGALAAHFLWAVVTILIASWLAMWVLEQYGRHPLLERLGKWMAGLIGTQMLLGGVAFLVTVMGGQWPGLLRWAVPSLHVLVGALMLSCTLMITLCAWHVLCPADGVEVGVLPNAATVRAI
ncbi:MAG: hypothetical protein AABZ12_01120 [Planctomycetota bacterium]